LRRRRQHQIQAVSARIALRSRKRTWKLLFGDAVGFIQGLEHMEDPRRKWPRQLWVVRHGQSAGNVARAAAAAEAAGVPRIDIATRDMVLRLRSMLDTMIREYREESVLIVAHQVIVNCLRYLLERMDEQEIMEIDRQADVPNCSVTSYEFDPRRGRNGELALQLLNFVAPLEEAGASVTSEPDVPGAPRS
jgi:broad specificity phosphatase PhoE